MMAAGLQTFPPLNFTLAKSNPFRDNPLISTQTVQNEKLKNFSSASLQQFIETDLLKVLNASALPALSNGASCVGDTVADLSWLLRTLMPEAPSTEWVGLTTGENVIRGARAAIKAW